MIILRVWRSKLPQIPEFALQNLSAALVPSLRSIIRPALEVQAGILGTALEVLRQTIPSLYGDPRQQTIDGEIFTNGTSLFVVEIAPQDDDRARRAALRVWEAERSSDIGRIGQLASLPVEWRLSFYYIGPCFDDPQLHQVEGEINNAFNVSLQAVPFESRRFKELREEGRAPPLQPEPKESEASRALSDRQTRALAVAIKSSGGLLVRDLTKQLPPEARDQTEEIRRTLESRALIDAEFVVVCKKSQAQIARVPSRDALLRMSEQGLRCACGRPIGEESVEEAVSITDLGRDLLDGSRWLTLLLLEALQRVGVPLNDTLIEQQVGGDEVDCLAVVSGELAFFELKDKDFNLGNAYSFGAKMGIIRPDHAVIFSTQKIGGDAREHFERARLARNPRSELVFGTSGEKPSALYYIEGLEHLCSEIQNFVSKIYRDDALRILSRVLPLAAVQSQALLSVLENKAKESPTHAEFDNLQGVSVTEEEVVP